MCVYNGERFLIEQLESIRNQTYQPDEVAVYDDGSTDLSIEIINTFISKYNLESTWRIAVNSTRKGWRKNFYDAITECNSDYIFFCDQDDIWHPDKILVMMNTMQENPNILVLNGLIETIDSDGNHIDVLDWTKSNTYDRKIIRIGIGEIAHAWKHRVGCAMAIRKIVKEQLKYFECNEYFAHDTWANDIGALLNGCYSINYPVIKYRVHEDNATARNTVKALNREERIQKLEGKINGLRYISKGIGLINTELINEHEYSIFINAVYFYEFKVSSIKEQKPTNALGIFLYIKLYLNYFNFKQFVVDILEALNLRDNARAIKHSIKTALRHQERKHL